MNYLSKIDGQILKRAYMRPFRKNILVKSLIFIGDGPFWLILVCVSALAGQLLKVESFDRITILLMTGLLVSNFVFLFFKKTVKRKRPYADKELQQILSITIQNRDPGHASKETESFPSGHVLWTTLCVSLICFQFGYIPALAIGWLIPAMIFLRLHLGVHYPSDVLAGFLLGAVNAVITVILCAKLIPFISVYKGQPGYIGIYWISICIYMILGFRAWKRRV